MASKAGIMRSDRTPEPDLNNPLPLRTSYDNEQHRSTQPEAKPSSSTEGFFQTPPEVLNQLSDDIALQRSLRLFLPDSVCQQITPELAAFGDKVLSKPVLDLVADAEKNLPYVKHWDSWGRRKDELVTSEGWRKLSAIGIEEGMVAIGYENRYGQFSRAWQFLKYLVWTGSSAWVSCPSLMTDGVATLLRRHLSSPGSGLDERTRIALQSAYDRLISRDPLFAWTTGQWMTERQGGSDVSQTETLARYAPDAESQATSSDGSPLGPWLCNGFKWFSSATDSQMMTFLARTPKGISTFMAPMHRTITTSSNGETELNGIQIQRLKSKLGTRALPTAELVLQDVRAHLIGTDGAGVKEIATVLNIARVHNAVTAIGLWGRGLSIIRAFARVRNVGLKPLWSKPAFMRALAQQHVEYRANVHLCTFVASLLGAIEQPQIAAYENPSSAPPHPIQATTAIPDPNAAEHLFRLLTPVLKGLTAKSAIAGLAECMELMGGVGYLDPVEDQAHNIARLYRDVNVCSIWEGTTDMMALDVLRVVLGKTGKEVMGAVEGWLGSVLGSRQSFATETDMIERLWKEWHHSILSTPREELELHSRAYMVKLGNIIMGALLILDGDEGVMRSWMQMKGYDADVQNVRFEDVVSRDLELVFGDQNGPAPTREEKARL